MKNQIELELAEHKQSPPDKGSKSRNIQDYLDKELYLEFEVNVFAVGHLGILKGLLLVEVCNDLFLFTLGIFRFQEIIILFNGNYYRCLLNFLE